MIVGYVFRRKTGLPLTILYSPFKKNTASDARPWLFVGCSESLILRVNLASPMERFCSACLRPEGPLQPLPGLLSPDSESRQTEEGLKGRHKANNVSPRWGFGRFICYWTGA